MAAHSDDGARLVCDGGMQTLKDHARTKLLARKVEPKLSITHSASFNRVVDDTCLVMVAGVA